MKAATRPGGRVTDVGETPGCGRVLQEVQDDGTRAALVEYVDLIRSASSN